MAAKYVSSDSKKIICENWGTLQWIVDGKDGTSEVMTVGKVTIYPEKSNPYHTHPNCEEILYVITGELEHTIDEERTVRLSAGDTMVIPQGERHNARNIGKTDAVVLVSFNNANRLTVGE